MKRRSSATTFLELGCEMQLLTILLMSPILYIVARISIWAVNYCFAYFGWGILPWYVALLVAAFTGDLPVMIAVVLWAIQTF